MPQKGAKDAKDAKRDEDFLQPLSLEEVRETSEGRTFQNCMRAGAQGSQRNGAADKTPSWERVPEGRGGFFQWLERFCIEEIKAPWHFEKFSEMGGACGNICELDNGRMG